MRIAISGKAVVRNSDGEVTDPETLRRFDGVVSDRETFTEYLGGIKLENYEHIRRPGNEARYQEKIARAKLENSTREAVQAGGHLRFVYKPAENELWVVTEYEAVRELSDEELAFLAEYTRSQWSDGIGENFLSVSQEEYGFVLDCSEVTDPVVEVTRP